MLHRLLAFVAVFLLPLPATADTLKSEAEARQLADKVMARVAAGDTASAFETMRPYVVIPESEFQSIVLQSKSQREQFGARYGRTIGYEFISERKAGDSISRLIYVEKTEKHALPWLFMFYKAPSGWVLNAFAWNDNIQGAFAQ